MELLGDAAAAVGRRRHVVIVAAILALALVAILRPQSEPVVVGAVEKDWPVVEVPLSADAAVAQLVREDGRRRCLASMTREMVELTKSLVIPKKPVVYIDPPLHMNLGDSYIWSGAYVVMDQLGIDPVITCTHYKYGVYNETLCDLPQIQKALRDGGTILFHGGGNFGDTYYDLQKWRVSILGLFTKGVRVVYFPQSIEYRNGRLALQDFTGLANHPDVHIMARCTYGYNYALETIRRLPSHIQGLKDRVYLVPDMAFALGDLSLGRSLGACPHGPTHDIVFLMRKDHEADPDVKQSTEKAVKLMTERNKTYLLVDWFDYFDERVRLPLLLNTTSFSHWPFDYRAAADARVAMGLSILCHGRAIVTDRLHALVLGGMLMGKPVVFMDNFYKKTTRVVSTWVREDSQHGCFPRYMPLYSVAESRDKTLHATETALSIIEHSFFNHTQS